MEYQDKASAAALERLQGGSVDPLAGVVARAYLESLGVSSRKTMDQALNTVARHLAGEGVTHRSLRWDLVRHDDVLRLRQAVAGSYAAGTIKKMVAGIRAILESSRREGFLTAQEYLDAVEPLRKIPSKTPDRTRLTREQSEDIYNQCRSDTSAAGLRDSAILAVLCGGWMTVERLTSLTMRDVKHLMETYKSTRIDLPRWVRERGTAPGPLFCRLLKSGSPGVAVRRLSTQAIHSIVRARGLIAGYAGVSPASLLALSRKTRTPPLADAIHEWKWTHHPRAKFRTEVEQESWRQRRKALRQTKRTVGQTATARRERLARMSPPAKPPDR